jgi:peptide/nickel transport system permease protein
VTARGGRLPAILERVLPGAGHVRAGAPRAGVGIALAFCVFPAVLVANGGAVLLTVRSFLLSLWLLASGGGEFGVIFRLDVLEYWIAVAYAVVAPLCIRWLARRALAHRRERDADAVQTEWGVAFRQFRENRLALSGAVLIAALYSVAILSPLLAPFRPDAFQDGLVTQFRAPLSTLTALRLRHPRVAPVDAVIDRERREHAPALARLLGVNALLLEDARASLMFVDAYRAEGRALVVTTGEQTRRLPIEDLQGDTPAAYATTRTFLLGTDSYGRDILSRMLYGSRVSLSLGIIAVLLSVTLGVAAGLSAGYFGRMTDTILMRFADILLSFPSLFLILIIVAVFEKLPVPRIFLIVIVLGLSSWMGIARLVRGEVQSIREREFITAAQAAGLGQLRILLRHILPNVLTPVIVNATLRIGGMILIEAALSYLNLGVQAPTASWGNIIFEGKDALVRAWWISTFPGLAIVFTVVSFNLIGDGLRDALDPMLKDT